MAITGAHILIYSPEAEKLRATLRDVLGWHHVDDGDGWLIFALPPAEVGVHPSEGSTGHELSLMCDDVRATVAELAAKGIEFRGEPQDEGFGIGVDMLLPGGVEVLLYEPRHASPLQQ
jgi:catechol 2,3-dioxygenase-like lactoylglutathione lyase family enzyme